MKKTNIITYIALTSLTALVCCFPLMASDSMSLDGINSNYMQQESITFNNVSSNVYTGGITGTLGNGLNQFFFCYDISHSISVPGTYNVNLISPSATNIPSYLSLSSNFNLEVASSLLNHVNLGSFTSVNQFSGLQLAMWSILYNWTPTSTPTNTLGTSSNVFSSSATGDTLSDALADLQLAQSFVANNTYSTSFGNVNLLANTNDSQGNVTQTLGGSVATPEPQTYILLGTFITLFACYAKRRQTA